MYKDEVRQLKGGNTMNRYNELLEKANVADWDRERQALFFLIANNDELYQNVNKIYDFKRNSLKSYENEENESGLFLGEEEFIQLSSSAKAFIRLGFALFNGRECDVFNTFANLGQESYSIVISAINLRFDFKTKQIQALQEKKEKDISQYKAQIISLVNENRENIKSLNISKVCRLLEINRATFYNLGLNEFLLALKKRF